LLVCLGNPGDEYVKTRHNVGFLFADKLVSEKGGRFAKQARCNSEVSRINIGGNNLHVIKPQTFMNKSGHSVACYAKYYNIQPDEILIVHDDLDLEPGQVRFKKSGGHGGHNGLRDVFNQLSSREFYRLRIGIGHPGDKNRVADFVLSSAGNAEQALIDESIQKGLSQIDGIVLEQYDQITKFLHSS